VRHQSKDVNRFQVCLLDDTLPCGVVRWNWFSGVMELQSTLTRAYLHQFLTYSPMRLTSAAGVLRLRKFARVFGTTLSLRV
jgi:hypothetical protein